ncbi:GntR family transcriptional regulator [Streptococcus caprae]|uniref:GntR family transcriptional regulator n=1 Tax=Streptococcus caprae TaxID=1640501 RepID=A0ABV8CX98_9STRE
MKFDFESDVALFLQVAQQLETDIFHKVYLAGEQVPSTTEISMAYQINPATVLKGMNILVQAGVLEKRRGMGTFVTEQAWEILREKKYRLFSQQQLQNFIETAKALGISKSDLLILIEGGYDELKR